MDNNNNKAYLKRFFIKLAAITFAIIVIINVTYNLIFAEKLENINKLLSLNNKENIDIWGDGKQTRSFLYIDDCIEGTLKLFNSNFREPLNIGSDEQVSINELVNITEKVANIKLKKSYQLDKPKGVRGRSSNNEKMIKNLKWNYTYKLERGIKKTYKWIYNELREMNPKSKKFQKNYK